MNNLIRKHRVVLPEWPLFDDFITKDLFRSPLSGSVNGLFPAVNIKESDNAFELEIIVPGFNKEDFKLELENNTLTVSSQREEKKEENENAAYRRKEYRFTSFNRSFTLPENGIDTDAIAAAYVNGVLNITLPKKQKETAAVRKIDIA